MLLGRCVARFPPASHNLYLFRQYATADVNATDRKKAYSHTLLLPKTKFVLKHKDPAAIEQGLRLRTADALYRWQRENNDGEQFVLMDGPPYANGNLHMGHALNKILKDIINRYKVLRGFKVHYVPGWDCHGLPIEQKALAAISISHTKLDPLQVRQVARSTAMEAIDVQKREMKALGVMADWDNQHGTYRTLDHDFQIRQLKLFQKMITQGHVSHRLRPTYYSPASRTALAEAELVYRDDHRSRSIYVGFPVLLEDMSDGLREVYKQAMQVVAHGHLWLGIWTTTPWTLPSNMGVNVHEDFDYVIVQTTAGQLIVIMEDRLAPMEKVIGEVKVIGCLRGSAICGTRYTHPLHTSTSSSERLTVFHADHVSAESGTGLVHSAPGHGHEDYQSFLRAGISLDKLRSPVNDDGCFVAAMDWLDPKISHSLEGKEVLGKGNDAVVELMRDAGYLLAEEKIKHKYPYDWKSKTPTIIRATPQWFADVESIKQPGLEALENVKFYPPQSRHRLEAFIKSRSEWCISRQRSWGVPIPILFDSEDRPVLSDAAVDHAIAVLEANGVDHWWSGKVEEFVPEGLQGQGLRRGTDTLDVWFDSGSAWTSLGGSSPDTTSIPPSDIYLEGSDQHRGWFQSSLLTKLGQDSYVSPLAPYRTLITHGFIVDENSRKMSKSSGNGISPMQIISGVKGSPGLGADPLRIWAASVDYHQDVSIGTSAISQASETLRKLRSVLRFLVANTGQVQVTPVTSVQTCALDRYVLQSLNEVEEIVQQGYEQFAFNKVLQTIVTFASSTLSTIYFDAIKDILYCDHIDSTRRQAILSTLQEVLKSLHKMIAPITPFLAEELNDFLHDGQANSVFTSPWEPSTLRVSVSSGEKRDFNQILEMRSHILQLIESARTMKHIRVPSEAHLHIQASDAFEQRLHPYLDQLPRIFTVSGVSLEGPPTNADWSRQSQVKIGENNSITLTIVPARHDQCVRCWLYHAESGDLCSRCQACV